MCEGAKQGGQRTDHQAAGSINLYDIVFHLLVRLVQQNEPVVLQPTFLARRIEFRIHHGTIRSRFCAFCGVWLFLNFIIIWCRPLGRGRCRQRCRGRWRRGGRWGFRFSAELWQRIWQNQCGTIGWVTDTESFKVYQSNTVCISLASYRDTYGRCPTAMVIVSYSPSSSTMLKNLPAVTLRLSRVRSRLSSKSGSLSIRLSS